MVVTGFFVLCDMITNSAVRAHDYNIDNAGWTFFTVFILLILRWTLSFNNNIINDLYYNIDIESIFTMIY